MQTNVPSTVRSIWWVYSIMLAAAGGGPIASGVGVILARANISHQLISDVVTAVEKAFSEHGERALRENCGPPVARRCASGTVKPAPGGQLTPWMRVASSSSSASSTSRCAASLPMHALSTP
jgi:alkylated DNA nucleotide flippase Atl1